jgi:hypothetical protein
MKQPHNWNRTGAIAGVVGAVVAIFALGVSLLPLLKPADYKRVFDGPVAQIAVREKSWDDRGFKPEDLASMASEIEYRYAGHYVGADGDRNPSNTMCAILLHANPSSTHPYGGESGFVYVQNGTDRKAEGIVLHNPTLDDIYTTRMEYEYVQAECWSGKSSLKYPY